MRSIAGIRSEIIQAFNTDETAKESKDEALQDKRSQLERNAENMETNTIRTFSQFREPGSGVFIMSIADHKAEK